MKAIILSRVSTNEQQDGHSIAAQQARLREYCKRKNLDIIKEFEIIESSTRGKRKGFYEMLEFAKKQKEIVAIVADKIDRVQRSFNESVVLDELRRQEKIELHFYTEGIVINKHSKANDIMMWDFGIMGAKSYVLSLSDNVKRSVEYKIANGEWAGRAPVGYLNVKDKLTGKNTIILDPDRSYLIKRLFAEYAKGTSSFNKLAKLCESWGLTNTTSANKPLSHNVIKHLLENPFYYGYMRIKGELHKHVYEPLIDEYLFNQCQEVRKSYKRKPTRERKHDFIFKGLIRCATSNRIVSSDIKKSKYIYLMCRNPQNPDKKLFIKEEEVLSQVKEVFKSLKIPEELFKTLQQHLINSAQSERYFHEKQIKHYQNEAQKVQKQLNNLLDMRLNESITQDEHDKKATELRQRQREINVELKLHNQADEKFAVTLTSLISLASRAYEIFESSKIAEKRQLIYFMFSNLKLNGSKLEYTLNEPFHLFAKPSTEHEWLGN